MIKRDKIKDNRKGMNELGMRKGDEARKLTRIHSKIKRKKKEITSKEYKLNKKQV